MLAFTLGLSTVLCFAVAKVVVFKRPTLVDWVWTAFEIPVDLGFVATSLAIARIAVPGKVQTSAVVAFILFAVANILLVALWHWIEEMFDKHELNLRTGGWIVVHYLVGVMTVFVAAGQLT